MSADAWIDRPRNIVIMLIVAVFVGAGLGAIDEFTQSDTDKAMFYFCSLPSPAQMKNKTPLTGVDCFSWRHSGE